MAAETDLDEDADVALDGVSGTQLDGQQTQLMSVMGDSQKRSGSNSSFVRSASQSSSGHESGQIGKSRKKGIDKQTFNTLEALKNDEDKNMYELVYSRGKTLKDDNRLAYYSFYMVVHYKEVIYLGLFAVIYTCASGLNMLLLHPTTYDSKERWPFVFYARGAFIGLLAIMVISDFIF